MIALFTVLIAHNQAVSQRIETLNTLDQQEIADGWILLFDGKTQTAGVVLNKMKLLVGKYRMVTWLALW